MSLIFGFIGPFSDVLYTRDWWHPLTVTNTKIGPEAIIVGFAIGGIASVIYEDIFKKKIRTRRVSRSRKRRDDLNFSIVLIISGGTLLGAFFFLGLGSLLSTVLAFGIPAVIIWIRRHDLILDSLASGIFLLAVACFVYSVLQILTPGWIQAFWTFRYVPDITILSLPINDVLWYFLAGLFIGPLYEYWKEGKLVKA